MLAKEFSLKHKPVKLSVIAVKIADYMGADILHDIVF